MQTDLFPIDEYGDQAARAKGCNPEHQLIPTLQHCRDGEPQTIDANAV